MGELDALVSRTNTMINITSCKKAVRTESNGYIDRHLKAGQRRLNFRCLHENGMRYCLREGGGMRMLKGTPSG